MPGRTSHTDEVEAWRARRLARLTAPDGWLTLVGLEWLQEGANPIGSDPSNLVGLPGGKAPPQLGSIEVSEGKATIEVRPGSGVTHEGRPITRMGLRDDTDGDPTVLRLGTLSFHVINREGALAVRIKDRHSPIRTGFRGIDHYPVDPRWRIEARFDAYDPPKETLVPDVLGRGQTYRLPGAVVFEVEGMTHRLETFLEAGERDLFLVFGDETNGDETYGGGRYLYAAPPDERGIVVVDFNMAYNPPCVFTPYATCALPLPENRLPIRIEAGEKRYRQR
ncbi:MAG: DUF1684 domain-containing protein [Actinomycetota bacterium]